MNWSRLRINSRKIAWHTSAMVGTFRLRLSPASVGDGVTAVGSPIVTLAERSQIHVGDGTVLVSNPRYTDLGTTTPTILRTLRSGATINIGKNCGLSGTRILAAHAVTLGDECLLGADVTIADTDFHPLAAQNRRFAALPPGSPTDRITLGKNVFVGTRAIILKGVSLGDNTVVAAGAVVTRSFPNGSIIAGVPARLIGRVPAS